MPWQGSAAGQLQEGDYPDAGGLLLVVAEARGGADLPGPDAVAVLAGDLADGHLVGIGAGLDGGLPGRHQVVVPRRRADSSPRAGGPGWRADSAGRPPPLARPLVLNKGIAAPALSAAGLTQDRFQYGPGTIRKSFILATYPDRPAIDRFHRRSRSA